MTSHLGAAMPGNAKALDKAMSTKVDILEYVMFILAGLFAQVRRASNCDASSTMA